MAEIQKPITEELAPANETAAMSTAPYLSLLSNPDSVMATRGGTLKVYAEVARDDQVKSTFQQRRLAVVSSDWEVDPGIENNRAARKAADALRENLTRINFDAITDKQLWTNFWGYGVGEIMWQQNGAMIDFDVKIRDRSRFRFDVDNNLILLKQAGSQELMPDRKFWVVSAGADHDDNPYGLGLAHWLYWPVFFKRNDIKFWLIFLEKFGMPTPMGKAPAGKLGDPEWKAKALAALRSITTDAAVLMPDDVPVELLEASRSGAGTYDAMHDAMNEAITKIVLSQTMTTDNGSSKSQSETHADVRDMVVKADADLICESFNRTVVKWWCEYNFGPNVAPPRVYRKTDPPEDLSSRAERDTKIKALGYEPTPEYVEETYGKGWVKSQAAEQMAQQLAGQQLGKPAPGQDPNQDPQDFAELAKLMVVKAAARGDHTSLVAAANLLASQYEKVIGDRVQQLLEYAETSGDFETFQRHLVAMMAEQAPKQTVDTVERANFFSRLMGAFRAQR